MGGIYYLPPPVDDWYSHHSSTSAWKANNAFGQDAQMYFHDVEHPRFGLMPALTAMKVSIC